jgi:hypothetical protein
LPVVSVKNILKTGGFGIVGAMMLFSCTTPEDSPQQMKELERIAKKSQIDLNEPGLTFAAALAAGLKEETLRSFVFDKTQEQFDGDFNFLYYTEKSTPVGGPNSKSVTFEEALFGDPSRFKMSNTMLDFDPLMQVALRGEEEDLYAIQSLSDDVPVFYISPDQDLDQNPIVPVFYSDGEVGEWDINQVPDEPVLVIGLNERLIKVERGANQRMALSTCLSASDPYFSDGMNDYYFIDDYMCGGTSGGGSGTGGSGGSGTGGSTGCDRDMNSNWDRIDRVRFITMKNLRDAEEWVHGAPEVYFIIFTGSSQSHLAQIRKSIPEVDRSKWKDCGLFSCNTEWVFPNNLEVFNWEKMAYSQIITIQWYERDPGDSETRQTEITYKDPVTGITYTEKETVTISNNDEDLDMTPVEYCHDATGSDARVHTTGKIEFVLRVD